MTFDLITFGCSWTLGRGVGYEKGMDVEKYLQIIDEKEICDKYSFRGILSKKWGCNNINYACAASSNQKQFRLALEHFKSKPSKKTVVLWAITSIFRDEIWYNNKKEYINILYGSTLNGKNKLDGVDIRERLKNNFDVDNQLQVLCNQMDHWNLFFKQLGIENYWMDTFNHHNYPYVNSRMLFNKKSKRDLCSILVDNHDKLKYDTKDVGGIVPQYFDYLKSKYMLEKNSRNEAKKLGLVNHFSSHPTKEAHIKIANFIDEEINLINNKR